MKIQRYIISTAVALALAACSVGGGGGSAKQFTAFSVTTPGDTLEMPARTLVADYNADLNDGTIIIEAREAKDATFRFALGNSDDFTQAALSIAPDPGFSTPTVVGFNTSNGDGFVDGDQLAPAASGYFLAATASIDQLAVISDHTAMGFEYQSFGVWLTGIDVGIGIVAVSTAGAPTDVVGVPILGMATYNGESLGFYVDADGDPFLAFADFSAMVDFGAPAEINVLATNTQVVNANTGVASNNADLDFAGSGAVAADGTFSASIAATDLAGGMDGLLYGPTAQELGAVFDMSGANGVYIGAVGAAQ